MKYKTALEVIMATMKARFSEHQTTIMTKNFLEVTFLNGVLGTDESHYKYPNSHNPIPCDPADDRIDILNCLYQSIEKKAVVVFPGYHGCIGCFNQYVDDLAHLTPSADYFKVVMHEMFEHLRYLFTGVITISWNLYWNPVSWNAENKKLSQLLQDEAEKLDFYVDDISVDQQLITLMYKNGRGYNSLPRLENGEIVPDYKQILFDWPEI